VAVVGGGRKGSEIGQAGLGWAVLGQLGLKANWTRQVEVRVLVLSEKYAFVNGRHKRGRVPVGQRLGGLMGRPERRGSQVRLQRRGGRWAGLVGWLGQNGNWV
jgi:hypothetical protein